MVTSNLVEAVVSVNRLSTFFHADELQTDARKLLVKDDLRDGDEVSGPRLQSAQSLTGF